MFPDTPRSDAVSSVLGVVLMIAVVVVVAASLSVFVLLFTETVREPAPVAQFDVEYNYFGDGVAKNDSVVITHLAGDELERERLEVVIGDDVVYNATADSETTNTTFTVPGLRVEVDDDEFNDLNKPCRVDGALVSPSDTCGGPPGDGDGSDPGVVLQWSENVSAGQRIAIQERNATDSYDVMNAGERIRIIYRGDDFSAVLAEETVAPRVADDPANAVVLATRIAVAR